VFSLFPAKIKPVRFRAFFSPSTFYHFCEGMIMKILLKCMIFGFLVISFSFSIGIAADVRPTVAILDFESVGSEEHLGKAVSEIMRTELIGTRQFRVVERSQINKALSEQQFQKSGVINENTAVEIGKLLGADLIIIGSVVKIGTSYTINSRMLDIKTGEATLGKNVTGNDLNLLTNMSRSLIDNLFTPGKVLDAEREQLSAEHRKLGAEKQQKVMVPRSTITGSKEIGRGGRFIAYNNGTVLDTQTNLMWAAKDNGSDINWANAKSYCENYRGGGYSDWRMPTQDELAGLYDSSKRYKATQHDYNLHLSELIQLSACCPWASETRGSKAARFHFGHGLREWLPQSSDFHRRALPVRSGK
jgi:TolB-like protein